MFSSKYWLEIDFRMWFFSSFAKRGLSNGAYFTSVDDFMEGEQGRKCGETGMLRCPNLFT